MNGRMHLRITECAVQGLGLSEALAAGVREGSNAPDTYYGVAPAEMPPEMVSCIWLPGGGNAHQLMDPLRLRETYPQVSDFWLEQAVQRLRAGDDLGAGRMLGCWSHLSGDTAQAAHLMDERILADLFPQRKTCYLTHRVLESISADLPPREKTPRILGRSVPELTWRAVEELACLQRQEKAELPCIVPAVECHDDQAAVQSAMRSALHAAELLADVLATVWRLAGRDSSYAYEAPDVRQLVPVDEFCDSYFNYRVMVDRMPGKDIYEPMVLDIGDGPVKGLAMLVYLAPFADHREAFAEYAMPGEDVFENFKVTCGLQRGVTNETQAIFRLEVDGRLVAETKPLGADDAPCQLSCSLKQARRLRLSVIDARKELSKTKFFYPVWANPTFC